MPVYDYNINVDTRKRKIKIKIPEFYISSDNNKVCVINKVNVYKYIWIVIISIYLITLNYYRNSYLCMSNRCNKRACVILHTTIGVLEIQVKLISHVRHITQI